MALSRPSASASPNVGQDHRAPEGFGNLVEHGRTRSLYLSDDRVCVDDERTVLLQHPRNG